MARNIIVTLELEERNIKELKGLDFGTLISDIDFLAQQPPVEVYPCYRDKKIDYERGGYRSVRVRTEPGRPLKFSYVVIDRVSVRGSVNHSDQVGMKSYTQKEVDELRGQRG